MIALVWLVMAALFLLTFLGLTIDPLPKPPPRRPAPPPDPLDQLIEAAVLNLAPERPVEGLLLWLGDVPVRRPVPAQAAAA